MTTAADKTVYIKTFGCQMNENDTQRMLALLAPKGYLATSDPKSADLILINSCSIREKSYQKALSEIGRFKKHGKLDGLIGLTGCVASQEGEKLTKRFPFLNLVLGTDHLAKLPKLIDELKPQKSVVESKLVPLTDYRFAELPPFHSFSSVKSSVTIMKGCDNACSFCIVPFVRGKEVSRSPDEILAEIRKMEGVRELLLLGQNVNSYGKRLSPKTTFAELLRRIDEETGILRLRYVSPHPKDLSDQLINEHVVNTKLCRHIHLPVQSGSSRVLKKMRRSYTREVYLRKVEKLRQKNPDMAISTDIIVGFPGESLRDFAETLSLMKEVRFDASYSFTYSPRPQTESSLFVDDVLPSVKEGRLKEVQALQAEIGLLRNQEKIGRVEEVLVEGISETRGGKRQLFGRTSGNQMVNFDGDEGQIGAILKVQIKQATPYVLKGRLPKGGIDA
ncbi:MAG: tRNA (N6-isopentenyl adenosine(37)-C2)-methylthiotransferase MiaB [Deltaproteobacteria bacterium]|nr:tRNA (N6-isopentenyl adenosine(37)-C2)-methylthiotransferase MiaB [Deltaproteobacteria bacterium]